MSAPQDRDLFKHLVLLCNGFTTREVYNAALNLIASNLLVSFDTVEEAEKQADLLARDAKRAVRENWQRRPQIMQWPYERWHT